MPSFEVRVRRAGSPLELLRQSFELEPGQELLFGRAPDADGRAFWIGQLAAGRSRGSMIVGFSESPEYVTATATGALQTGFEGRVYRLYLAYFRRWPDQGGLDYWLGRFRAGTSLTEISENFARSPEFDRTYGDLDDRAFIALVYENVLGRQPDQGGYDFWTAQIESGLTRGGLMTAFSESLENVERTDPQIVVRSLYRGLLQREPDPGGNDFWTGYYADTGSLVSMIDGFLTSNEYGDRFWVDDPVVAGLESIASMILG